MKEHSDLNSASPPPQLCPHCGQDTVHRHSDSSNYLEEALELGFHLDHRILRTIPLLLIPGALAKKYQGSDRPRYTPPLKLYVFLWIFAFSLHLAVPNNQDFTAGNFSSQLIQIRVMDHGTKVSQFEVPLADEQLTPKVIAFIDSIDRTTSKLKISPKDLEKRPIFSIFGQKLEFLSSDILLGKNYDDEKWEHNIRKVFPITLLFLFPLIGFLLVQIYRKEKISFWNHLAFALYCQSSIYLLSIAVDSIRFFNLSSWNSLSDGSILVGCTFALFSQKKFYQQTWTKTLMKFLILAFAYACGIFVTSIFSMALSVIISS